MSIPKQPLRGFVAQSMSGRKASPKQDQPWNFPASASTYSWSVPRTGKWKFVGWGAGGNGGVGSSGASGAYIEITKQLRRGQAVSIAVSRAGASDTVFTFPDGSTATAGRATTSTAGTASGGDVNINGSAGGLTGAVNGNAGGGTNGGAGGTTSGGVAGGSGSPANTPYKGGEGGLGSGAGAGIGGGGSETGAGATTGANGFALAVLIKGS